MLFEDKDEAVNNLLKSRGFNENSYIHISSLNFNIKSLNNIYNKICKGKFLNLVGFVNDFASAESILERFNTREIAVYSFNSSFFHMFLLYKENNTNQLNQFIHAVLDKFEYYTSSENIRMPFFSARIRFIVYFSNCLDSHLKNEIYSRIVNLSIVPENYTGHTYSRSECSLFFLMKSVINLETNPDMF